MDARELRRARRAERRQLAASRTAAGRDAPWRRRWRIVRRAVGNTLVGWFAPRLLRLLAWTWRVQRVGEPGLHAVQGEGPLVIALWHGRMLVPMPLWPHARRGFGVLVSPSDDGALVTRALRRFGYAVIRGSTSRGGASAMRELADLLKRPCPIVLTPDGPRGPRHTVNAGGLWLAREIGAPIVTLAIAVDRAWRLCSWDRFTIPKPFARVVVTYGEPLHVAADANDLALEAFAVLLRDRLLADERAGFARLQVQDDLGPT
jgi:lysophospholipid acyltransferase (LPLAT)-like uncharacterized protein